MRQAVQRTVDESKLNAFVGKAEPRIVDRFRTGDGLAWCDQDRELFEGTERFFRPGYAAHLVKEWIPALQGVAEKLARGAFNVVLEAR